MIKITRYQKSALSIAAWAFLAAGCAGFGPYLDRGAAAAWGTDPAPAFSGASAPERFRFLALSDMHGYARDQLVFNEGAYRRHLIFWGKNQDDYFINTKTVLESAALDRDLDFIVLPGDLTVDGELVSHELLVSVLRDFSGRRPDLPIYVTTGNHDVNSPQARRHVFPVTIPARSVSPAEFAALYAPFGYASALSRDAASLSYVVEPVPGVALMVLDTARWRDNLFFPIRVSNTKGVIRPSTLAWLEAVLAEARRLGMAIVVIQHHPPDRDPGKKKPSLQGSAEAVELYARYGTALVVAGHRHRYSLGNVGGVPLVVAGSLASSADNAILINLDGSELDVKRLMGD